MVQKHLLNELHELEGFLPLSLCWLLLVVGWDSCTGGLQPVGDIMHLFGAVNSRVSGHEKYSGEGSGTFQTRGNVYMNVTSLDGRTICI